MTIGIYGIFDSKTDECLYVGMSKNIEQRWKSHLKELRCKRHKRKDFVEWYHENGAIKELLVFRILEECEYDEVVLNNLEIKWFNELKPKYFGKKPSLNEKWEHSEETRKKISNVNNLKYKPFYENLEENIDKVNNLAMDSNISLIDASKILKIKNQD